MVGDGEVAQAHQRGEQHGQRRQRRAHRGDPERGHHATTVPSQPPSNAPTGTVPHTMKRMEAFMRPSSAGGGGGGGAAAGGS